MTNNSSDADNWGQLLSDFGIEDQKQEKIAQPEQPKSKVEADDSYVRSRETPSDFDDFGAGLIDSKEEVADEPAKTKEKKSIFSRFPKVSFFGAPPQVSLDSVIEGTKSSSLGGKGFTDNKLEKMPLSQERIKRQKKNKEEEPNTWSVVASQIETLASGPESKTKSDERPSKRSVSSMFDDPIPESEESRALKNLMGEPARKEPEERNAFLEEGTDVRRRGRGNRRSTYQAEEKETRGRGARYKPPVEVDDVSESDFESMDDESPVVRGRGGRNTRYDRAGSRYAPERDVREQVRDDEPQEEWSEIDAALQADQERPVQRGSRYRQDRDHRQDRGRGQERTRKPVTEQEPLDEEESGIITAYENAPNWDDAIGDIVSGNIARHRSFSGKGRRS